MVDIAGSLKLRLASEEDEQLMKTKVMFALLALTLVGFSACTSQNRSMGQSEVREAEETRSLEDTRENEHTGYGNPKTMDDWEQRGASGSPTGDKAPRE